MTELTARDFPKGFAESPGHSFAPTLLDLKGTDIFDAGIRDYGEFFAGLDHAWDLLHRQVVYCDGQPGKVSVAMRYDNAIQLRWRPL